MLNQGIDMSEPRENTYLQNTNMKIGKAIMLKNHLICKNRRLLLLNCSEFDQVSKNHHTMPIWGSWDKTSNTGISVLVPLETQIR